MEKISAYQLFSLTILYQVGTTIIFAFGAAAGRAAWIVVLISTVLGLLINLLYLILMRMHPGLTLVEWYTAEFGKYLGTVIAWVYPLQLLYVAGRIIGDLTILIPTTLLPLTPSSAYISLFLIVVIYILFNGIENIGRLGELILPVVFIFYFIELILIFNSDIVNIEFIKPYQGKGWDNIWKAVWPLGITQTFGQTIEFAMIWPLVEKQDKVIKISLIATAISGIFLASLNLLAVLVLGEAVFSQSIIPMYALIGMINVGDFITNLEGINVISFIFTAFIKICLHLYCAVRGIQLLTYSKSSRRLILPAVIIAMYLGMNMSSNTAEHLEVGMQVIPNNLWVPIFIILPVILLIVSLIRSKLRSIKQAKKYNEI